MRYAMTCALNGIGLQDLNEKIYIEDIVENPTISAETARRPGYGQFLLNTPGTDSLNVTVTFMLKERDRQIRRNILDKILAWAVPGYLTTNIREWKRLYVYCTQPPKVEAFKWTSRMNIVFTAYNEACWEDINPVTLTVDSATNAASSIFRPGGTRPCFLEAEITNLSNSALTSVVLTANGNSITLNDISVAKNSKVIFSYDENHILSITGAGSSILAKRTAASADDLLLTPNVNNTVSCVTNVSCETIFKARGLYR